MLTFIIPLQPVNILLENSMKKWQCHLCNPIECININEQIGVAEIISNGNIYVQD